MNNWKRRTKSEGQFDHIPPVPHGPLLDNDSQLWQDDQLVRQLGDQRGCQPGGTMQSGMHDFYRYVICYV